MIFLTVGSWVPFDRLVQAVDTIDFDEEVFAQIGGANFIPRNMKWVRRLEKAEFNRYMNECTAVIGHAGTGTINHSVRLQKALLVLPRLHEYGETLNDHQLLTAKKYESLGCILAAYDTDGLPAKIHELHTFVPATIQCCNEEIVSYVRDYIEKI